MGKFILANPKNTGIVILPNLELISYKHGTDNAAKPPLLFIHGAWHGAWCWDVHFLSYFFERGYDVYALSLSKHGKSNGLKPLWRTGITDYVADVQTVILRLPAPPVLIGHSMGGFIVQKILQNSKITLAGAVLMASVPHFGAIKLVLKMARQYPFRFIRANLTLSLYGFVNVPQLVKQFFFSANMPQKELNLYGNQLQNESYRIMWDLLFFQLPKPDRITHLPKMLVMGAENDFLFPPSDVHKTALAYHTQAQIIPNLAHDMMLDLNWKQAAEVLFSWLSHNFT